jgi:hypothetical protein
MLAVPGTTSLHRVTVRTSEPDALAVRTKFERAVSLGDLHPVSLPRSAILCVRSLRDCSRQLRLRATPDVAALNRWREATVAALDSAAHAAVRPARGPVPATAEAVLFANETEFLACLALDWCQGRFAERWWWRSLFANTPCPSWTAVWLEKPEFIPAAVELVAEQREVESLARNVTSAQARQLLAAVIERFGLRGIAAVLSRAEVEPATAGSWLAQEIRPSPGNEEALAPGMASAQIPALAIPVRPPWQRWVAETELPLDLGVDEQAWLGIALALQRAPRWARSAEFAEAIRKWIIGSQGIANAPLGVAKDEPDLPKTTPDAPIRELGGRAHVPSESMHSGEERLAPRNVRSVAPPPAMATPSAKALEQAGNSPLAMNRIEAESLSSTVAQQDTPRSRPLTTPDEFLTATHPLPSLDEPFRPSQSREREIGTNFGGVL